jgi:hypothetical protein
MDVKTNTHVEDITANVIVDVHVAVIINKVGLTKFIM